MVIFSKCFFEISIYTFAGLLRRSSFSDAQLQTLPRRRRVLLLVSNKSRKLYAMSRKPREHW